MELTVVRERTAPWQDEVWAYRDVGGGSTIADALLTSMEAALCLLAVSNRDPELFRPTASLLKDSQFETARFLLARAWAAAGATYADEAAEWLCSTDAHLRIGYLSDSHWATRELVAAITPHCSLEHLDELSARLLEYYPSRERVSAGRARHGYAQFILLGGFAASRRPPRVSRRLQELQRKFGREAPEPPRSIRMQRVEPPVPEEAAPKMTNAHWLRAIAKYSDDVDMRERGHRLIGGADELARLLGEQAKREPHRFATFATALPSGTHPAFLKAVLRGLTESTVDAEAGVSACLVAHALPGRPCGREIADLVEKLATEPLPEEILRIIAWYATEDPDPPDEAWRKPSPSGAPYYGGDIFTAGINSVRGRAALAITQLLFHERTRVALFAPTLDRMVEDPSLAVRSYIAGTLAVLLGSDRDGAVRLFLRLAATEDVLLSTRLAERFLFFGLQTDYSELLPTLERMLTSETPAVRTAGARLACAIALRQEEARTLADRCLEGSPEERLGAAEVFAANLGSPAFRNSCAAALARLFGDADQAVRQQAAGCFHHLHQTDLTESRIIQ